MNRIIKTNDPANRLDGDDSTLVATLTAHVEKYERCFGTQWDGQKSFKSLATLERRIDAAGIRGLYSIVKTGRGRYTLVVWRQDDNGYNAVHSGLGSLIAVR